jgi:hypothetical protein
VAGREEVPRVTRWKLPEVELTAAAAANVLALVALVVSIQTCDQTSKQHAQAMALTYRPRLTVPAGLELTQIELDDEGHSVEGDTVTTALSIRFGARARVVNQGEAIARIVAYAWSDTVDGTPVLRDHLLRGVGSIGVVEPSDFYAARGLAASDTTEVEFSDYDMRRSDGEYCVLHLLILYENEAGQLYDTYHWARYRLREVLLRNPVPIPNATYQITFDPRLMLSPVDANADTYLYRDEEAAKVRATLRRVSGRG